MAKEGNNYTYKEDRKVTLPVAHTSFAIEKREWNRLKDTVNRCSTDSQWFRSIAFCFFGIAGSAIITWLSLSSQKEVEQIRLILLIATIVSFLVGIIFLVFQLYINKKNGSSIDAIKSEIEYIEKGIPSEAS